MSWSKEEIKILRGMLHLEVGEFARILGVDERSVIRWEAGSARPTSSAEAVLSGLREQVSKAPNRATELGATLVRIAGVGGLAYLIVKLLDGIKPEKKQAAA